MKRLICRSYRSQVKLPYNLNGTSRDGATAKIRSFVDFNEAMIDMCAVGSLRDVPFDLSKDRESTSLPG